MVRPNGWWLAIAPVDLRCGMDRLLLLVQTQFGRDGFDGGAYVFRNRSGSRLKVVCADAQGVWLCGIVRVAAFGRHVVFCQRSAV
jgi:transposase